MAGQNATTDAGQNASALARRAVAYITHGDRLLVFRHTRHPEAGIQVPGGTIEASEALVGETPEAGALREAREETGLESLQLRSYLGQHDLDLAPYGRQGILRMYCYHLTCNGQPPERWLHQETDPSDGSPDPDGIRAPIEFELYWVRFPDRVPALVGEQGLLLHKLAL